MLPDKALPASAEIAVLLGLHPNLGGPFKLVLLRSPARARLNWVCVSAGLHFPAAPLCPRLRVPVSRKAVLVRDSPSLVQVCPDAHMAACSRWALHLATDVRYSLKKVWLFGLLTTGPHTNRSPAVC
jgi:hypothetical protein